MSKKRFYNQFTDERYQDAKVLNGLPSGIVNQVKTPHKWAKSLWDIMLSYTWFVSECNLGQDKVPYINLTEESRYAHDLALAQLITNDSIQTKQLTEGVNGYVTNKVINACLTRQAFEEALHATTYTSMAEDICLDIDRIYELHHKDKMLAKKNQNVADMFEVLNSNPETATDSDKQLVFVANQILEKLVFPGGFVVLWSFNFVGTNKAIGFIERD